MLQQGQTATWPVAYHINSLSSAYFDQHIQNIQPLLLISQHSLKFAFFFWAEVCLLWIWLLFNMLK